MINRASIVGRVFGRLTVLSRSPEIGRQGQTRWICRCVCGTEKTIYRTSLFNGSTQSCGCLKRENNILFRNRTTHGKTHTPVYQVWTNILTRCRNKKSTRWHRYGGRGITMCERWMTFENFYADMGDPPEGMELDRIDNDKGYSFDNCRWATRTQQANNRSNNTLIAYNGRTQTIAQWAHETGVHERTLSWRHNHGWLPPELFQPVKRRRDDSKETTDIRFCRGSDT